ncbi:UNVERIFIED_ORG: arabinogalactan endo-1,4-beta-galactosidase [Heyndrickxia coagulans]
MQEVVNNVLHKQTLSSFMNLLKNSGANYVNLKVAGIPANDAGKSYGGGNPTLGNAVKTARQPSQQD